MKEWEKTISKLRNRYVKTEASQARVRVREQLLGTPAVISDEDFEELKKLVEEGSKVTWPWKNLVVGQRIVLTKEDVKPYTLREASVKIYYYQQATDKVFDRRIENSQLVIERKR